MERLLFKKIKNDISFVLQEGDVLVIFYPKEGEQKRMLTRVKQLKTGFCFWVHPLKGYVKVAAFKGHLSWKKSLRYSRGVVQNEGTKKGKWEFSGFSSVVAIERGGEEQIEEETEDDPPF